MKTNKKTSWNNDTCKNELTAKQTIETLSSHKYFGKNNQTNPKCKNGKANMRNTFATSTDPPPSLFLPRFFNDN